MDSKRITPTPSATLPIGNSNSGTSGAAVSGNGDGNGNGSMTAIEYAMGKLHTFQQMLDELKTQVGHLSQTTYRISYHIISIVWRRS